MMSSELVFPGDEIAIEEEYMGGEGTFSEDGTVYAAQVGTPEFDDEECVVRIVSPNPPNILKEGDIVYAVVADIRNTMAATGPSEARPTPPSTCPRSPPSTPTTCPRS